MALRDTQLFLNDLLTRFDANLDISEGSRAQSELIDPILTRIGEDPFDDDIVTFIRTRIGQMFPKLAITEADELSDLLINPMRVLLEPVVREIQLVKLRTSLANVSALSDDEVDALLANFFEARKAGGFAVGVARAYYSAPQSVNVSLVNIASSRGGLRYLVTRPQSITADQMLLNQEGAEYYFDINYVAEARGDEYNVDRAEINSIANLQSATRITNPRRFTSGVARESSEDYVARVQQGTGDKTLTTAPGIIAVLNDNFPGLRQVFEIGSGDPEMMRDIITGGSLGAIPNDDDLGRYFGTATPIDDLNADSTTVLIDAPGGNFITRVGGAGRAPDGWWVTLVYTAYGELVVADVKVLLVDSDTRIRVDHQIPLVLEADSVTWALRRMELTISGIPGGITLPDTPNGELLLPSDSVHIGGKTDIFVAGPVDTASAQILGLADEAPLARGVLAQTNAATMGQEDVVTLTDIEDFLLARVQPGMSVVLAEGVDVGAYRIIQVLASPSRVRLDTKLTGTQVNLTWKIVDEIDVDLISPKDILLEGSDLVFSAGSPLAFTTGGVNFTAAGIRDGDILFADNPDYGGDFTITDVSPTALTISPVAPRALAGVHYVVSRRSEGVQRPVLRIAGLELLDSAGAPNGTTIPYRDPVLCASKAFQNEGSGFLYDGPALLGLISRGLVGGTAAVAGQSLAWAIYDASRTWAPALASGTFTFGVSGSATDLAANINADSALRSAGIRGVAQTVAGVGYVGFTCANLLVAASGAALDTLGIRHGATNASVQAAGLSRLKVRRGDLLECVGGNNAGAGARVLTEPVGFSGLDVATLGAGPLGPPGTTNLYDNVPLNPDPAGRIRVAHPSVGSVRCYFLAPTSIDFAHETTRFVVTINGQQSVYRPDPENTRTVLPPPPSSTLPNAGTYAGTPHTLTDANASFLRYGIREGDLLDLLYAPIKSTTTLPAADLLAVAGLTLSVRLDNDPFVLVSFPTAMLPADLANYINQQVGEVIATMATDYLVLDASRRIELSPGSTALGVLFLVTLTSDHPVKGTYVVGSVTDTVLTIPAANAPAGTATTAGTRYRIRRYLQRVSATEMNLNVDASGLYYADCEAVSVLPGDYNNIGTDITLVATGYNSDGYRLTSNKPELSFSRAEELKAQISRSILLVGASDNPLDYVQLNLQNVQVSYERSSLADDIQSFCSSRFRRVICEDILVRHLLPHYVSLNWRYSGGSAEPDMTRALYDFLAAIEGDGELEVGSAIDVLRGKQATSVFAVDSAQPSGRTAPLLLVVSHEEDRSIRAQLVRDEVDTVRMATYLPDVITLKRLSGAGLR